MTRKYLNIHLTHEKRVLSRTVFEKLPFTRKHLFETLGKLVLKPLPPHRFTYAGWSRAKVSIDYHIEVDHHYYSVPYQLIHQKVDARLTDATVEIFFKG